MSLDNLNEHKAKVYAEVVEYKAAEVELTEIAGIEAELNELFADALALITGFKKRMEKKLAERLSEEGLARTPKELEALQKEIRKRLFEPMIVIVEEQDGKKTWEQETFDVTLVSQKPKLEVTDSSLDAHKHDVHLLLDNNMYTSLSIVADDDTLSFMRLRQKNELENLSSVEIKEQGYCKVSLK